MSRFLDWLDHRTGYRGFVHEALYERVPGGARWRYVWGSTLVFAFIVQLITGFFLWAAYSPNAHGAWESVYYIQHEMQGGWLLRGLHHFMAQAMVVLLALHLMQVIIDGAYKAPREVNFWIGLVLALVVLGLSLTGYLLPWDQKGYWATKVATNIAAVTPVIGQELKTLIVGGSDYGHHTLTRFFALHAGLLPGLLILLLVAHIHVFRRHGLTAYKPEPSRDTTFWPDQVLRDAVACLAVLAVVLGLTLWPGLQGDHWGAHLGAPADPTNQYSAARPEWYFLFLFQLLKYFPGETEVIGSHMVPGLIFLVMLAMPFIGRWKLGHVFNVGFIGAVLIGIAGLTYAAIDEDQSDPDYRAAVAQAEKTAERVPHLVDEYGVSPKGAVALVRRDPYLQGPRVFARRCAACHRYNDHDGTGKPPETQATAADLGNFGTREWVKMVLLEYEEVFAPLQHATADGENVGDAFLEEGTMVQWSRKNRGLLTKDANQQSLDAVVEFLVAQSEREDLEPFDEELVKQGRQIFQDGKLPEGELSAACTECHALTPVGSDETLGDTLFRLAPDLTGYGGETWLRAFIADPGADKFYGTTTNAMPAFADQLTEQDFELLVRWLSGNNALVRDDAD